MNALSRRMILRRGLSLASKKPIGGKDIRTLGNDDRRGVTARGNRPGNKDSTWHALRSCRTERCRFIGSQMAERLVRSGKF